MKERVLFLDPRGTAWEVVRVAHERGFEPIALVSDPAILDGVPAPYGVSIPLVAKTVPVADWCDTVGLLGILAELRRDAPVVGVYFSSDPCAVPASFLREALGLPTTRATAMALVTDKFRLRRALQQHGLSRLQNFSESELEGQDTWPFSGAAYFKPRHGWFSAFVARCESFDAVAAAKDAFRAEVAGTPRWVDAYLKREGAGFHLEEAIEGELLSVEAISTDGKFVALGLLSRILYSKNAVVEMGSVFPYPHPLQGQIERVVGEAHRVLGISEGATHTEVIVGKNGEVEIIDLNPRFVGADVLQSVNFATGGRIEERLFEWAIGGAPDFAIAPRAYSCLQYVLPPEAMTVTSLDFPETPEVKFQTRFFRPGQTVTHTSRQIDYLGCYLTVMPSFSAALERSRELRSQVKINGTMEGAY